MVTLMNDQELTSLEQVRRFLEGAEPVAFAIRGKDACYAWIERTLFRFHYRRLGRADRGLIIHYLMKVSGYSRQQITRLIHQYHAHGVLKRRQRTVNGFQRRYTREDIRRLAEVDALHGTLSGPATKKLLERASELFGQHQYQRLAGISVSHLYNLRRSTAYARQRLNVHKTRSRPCAIGERRKPRPDHLPGFLRIDTVHQGDRDGIKGLYCINAVDEVTQFEVVAATERISEHYLLPVLELQLQAFPFRLQGFHSDSEYIGAGSLW
jgi:DNA-binding transcriptional MerR regulator